MISIDQNCHSLWDVLPKLQALGRRGRRVCHFVEDIDVAFTSLGSGPDAQALRLARERFHRGGGADWGAGLFYSEFLGRLPVEIRRWEAPLGRKLNVLARKLGCSVDALYDEFSPGGNWQLIGPSYDGDQSHHRVVGDLTVAETAEFVRQIIAKARGNCMQAFPQSDSQQRLGEWFDREERLVESLLKRCASGKLTDVYRAWLGEYLGKDVPLDLASSLFDLRKDAGQAAMLGVFLRDYDQAAGLYNAAIDETSVGLRSLKTGEGELPFFAVLARRGRLVRTAAYLDGGDIRFGDRTFRLLPGRELPHEELASAGLRCLAGKALLLVIQVRLGPLGKPLVLPYRGSLYMPAVHRLAKKLAAAKLLPGKLHPVVRVRFRLLDHLKQCDTVIHLPLHLASCLGRSEVPARRLGQNYLGLMRDAGRRLEAFADPHARERWQRETFPEIVERVEQLEARRRELARRDPKSAEIRALGGQQKQLQMRLLKELLHQVDRDTQLAEIDYWDSRGALLPWCVGLGGEPLYNELISGAELYAESEDTGGQ